MNEVNIYNYTDYRSYLNSHVSFMRKSHKNWSIGLWAKQLQISSTAVLSNILNGKRNPGKSIQSKLIHSLKLHGNNKLYFLDLIRLNKVADDPRLCVAMMDKLSRIHPNGKFLHLDESTFSSISKWYYYAIREMVRLPHFKEDPKWIVNNLQFKVSIKDVEKCLHDLLKLKLIYRDSAGKLKGGIETIKTTNDVSSAGLKNFHSEMIQNSLEAMHAFDVKERDITSRTINIRQENLPKLKEYIKEFRDKISELFEEESQGTHTYQLNVQAFPLSKGVK